MPNLLEETIQVLAFHELTPEDVDWCGANDSEYWFDWEQFASMADREYDAGYGGNEVARNLVIVGKDRDWWLTRGEYDGEEWWDFHSCPKITKPGQLPPTLFPKWGSYLGQEEE